MAQPLLDFLEGRARAALPFFRRGVAMGLGANDILIAVGERFGGIRRQTGLDIIAALRGPTNTPVPPGQKPFPERATRLIGENVPIPNDLHFVPPVNLSSNFQYVVRTIPVDLEAADYLTVSSIVPLSAGEIRLLGSEMINQEQYHDLGLGVVPLDHIEIVEANRNNASTTP